MKQVARNQKKQPKNSTIHICSRGPRAHHMSKHVLYITTKHNSASHIRYICQEKGDKIAKSYQQLSSQASK